MERPSVWAAAVLLVLAWWMPLHVGPWVSWHSEVLAFAGVWLLCAAALLLRLKQKESQQLPVPAVPLLLLSISLVAALQAAGGLMQFAGDAFVLFLYVAMAVAAFMVAHSASQTDDRDKRYAGILAWALLVGAVGSAFIAMVQTLNVWDAACLTNAGRGAIWHSPTNWAPCCSWDWPAWSFFIKLRRSAPGCSGYLRLFC